MLFTDFYAKLKKLNKNLWVDTEHSVKTAHPHFTMAGLYDKAEHIMAVSLNHLYDYSIRIVDVGNEKDCFLDEDHLKKHNLLKNNRLVSRSYIAILKNLVGLKKISTQGVKKHFGIDIKTVNPNRVRYLDYPIEA